MFYVIVCLLFVVVCVVFHFSGKEERTSGVIVAKFVDSCFSGIGAGLVVFYLSQYIVSLF